MSAKHPIIAVTGSSGAGTTTTGQAVRHIFRSLDVSAAFVEGDSFHRYSRPEMELAIRRSKANILVILVRKPTTLNDFRIYFSIMGSLVKVK